jgi:hypothetical protein
LGRAGLKEGAVVAVREKLPQKEREKRTCRKMNPCAELRGRKRDTPICYSGRTALRKEQCDM